MTYIANLAVLQAMDMDISSPEQHQLIPMKSYTKVINNPTKSTLKGKNSEAESTQLSSLLLLPLPDTIKTNKVDKFSVPPLDNYTSKEKKSKMQDK
ncbi:hypothetical protein RCL_jg28432.t1 [Rhizophagus clarus]|uniref:Uncharacterized protein n=1 Tax=Rhizophagus clarus TaxID=94130 RepID=A0A8H3M0N7_9GLOM|nr:hypothetical protein RCL_jg28432.t1 [Rhizophagus clarus]